MYFACTNEMIIDVHKQRYMSIFEKTAEEVYGKRYRIIIKLMSENEIKELSREPAETAPKPVKPAVMEEENDLREEYFLNPRYNFDNFIVAT